MELNSKYNVFYALINIISVILLSTLLINEPVSALEASVVVSQINLRSAPESGSKITAVMTRGTRVMVLERKDGWLKVGYGDRIGYLRDRPAYVKMGEYDSFPVNEKIDEPINKKVDIQSDSLIKKKESGNSRTYQNPPSREKTTPLIIKGEAEYAGVVYPKSDISLSMGVDGVVSSLAVKLGDAVRSGQLLLQLDDDAEVIEAKRRKVIYDNEAALNSLEEQISRSKILMDDVRLLYEESGAVSREEVLRSELEYYTLKGRYDHLKADKGREKLEYMAAKKNCEMRRLESPVRGLVTMLEIDVGEWVQPGKVLIQVMDTTSGILRLAVPESVARKLQTGGRVSLHFEEGSKAGSTSGDIIFVSPAADPASGLVKVEITFENKISGVRPGSKGYASLPASKRGQ